MSMGGSYQPRKNKRAPQARKSNKAAVDKALLNDGVYCNARLTHVATSLIGSKVQIQVRNGNLYQGIFKTFSPKMDVALELAHKVEESNPDQPPTRDCLIDKVIFNLNDVVMLSAIEADLEYAIKDATKKDSDGFTDTAISKFNGQIAEKELQPWEGDNPTLDGELEGAGPSAAATATATAAPSSANGWDAEDMFKDNADKFGVKTSYDPNLTAYTTALEKQDTKEYKDREARAARIAQEIEKSDGYKSRMDVENGDGDEEMAFSAVVRPDKDNPNGGVVGGKYVPPHMRKNGQPRTAPNRGGGKGGAQKGSGHSQSPSLPSADNDGDGGKSEQAEEHAGEAESGAADSNPHPKSDKEHPAAVSVSVTTGKGEVNKKQGGRQQQITELKEFSKTFKLGPDSDSKKQTSESTAPPAATGHGKSSTEAARLGTPPHGVGNTSHASDKGLKPGDKREKDHAAVDFAEKVKKSTLNPNAREFTLNPTAKPFVPRQPMQVATPPRPATQSPQGQSMLHMPPPMGQGQAAYQSLQQYQVLGPVPVSASPIVQQQPRFTNAGTAGKRVTVSVQRPEFNPVQAAAVQAATGQPLIAPQNMPQGGHQFVPQYVSQHMMQQGGVPQVYQQMVPIAGHGHRMVTPPVSHSSDQSQQGGAPTQVFVPHHGGPQVAQQLGGPGAGGQQPHPPTHTGPAHVAPHLHSTPPQSQPSHGSGGQGGPGGHHNPSPVPQGHPSAGHQQPGGHPPSSGTPQPPHNMIVYQPGTPQMAQQGHPPLQPSPHTPTSPQTMYPPGVAYSMPYSHSQPAGGQQLQAVHHQQGVHPNTTVTQAQHHQHLHSMPQLVMMPQHQGGGPGQMQPGSHGGGPPQQYPPHLQGHHAAMQGHHIQGVPGQAGPTMVPQGMNMPSAGVPQLYMPPQMPSQGPPPMQAYPHNQ